MTSASEQGQPQTDPTQQSSAQAQSAGNGGARGQRGASREGSEARRSSSAGGAMTRSPRQELMDEPRNAFELMWDLSRQMDRTMSSMFRSLSSGFFGTQFPSLSFGERGEGAVMPSAWMPRIDVEQRGNALRVCADLPGVRKEDVTIDLTE